MSPRLRKITQLRRVVTLARDTSKINGLRVAIAELERMTDDTYDALRLARGYDDLRQEDEYRTEAPRASSFTD